MKHVAARRVKPYGSRQDGRQFGPMSRKRTQHDRIILKMPKVDQEKRRLKKERKERRVLYPKYCQSNHARSQGSSEGRGTCVRRERSECQTRVKSHAAGT
jgi:hypothetical protein